MVEAGREASDFTLPSGESKKVRLREELGRGPSVLPLYVFDFTVLGGVRKFAA